MKKPVVIGCLSVVLLLLVVGGYFGYRAGKPFLDAFNAARDIGKIEQLDANVRNRSNFSAPADGVLSAAQVERYMTASTQITGALSGQVQDIARRYEQIEALDRDASLSELAGAWGDIVRLIVSAKEEQVNALNAADFSLGEYAWVRQQVFAAADLPVQNIDLVSAIGGAGAAVQELAVNDVPDENVALVAPYLEQIEELRPLAAFGL